jgi:hypothetical protein
VVAGILAVFALRSLVKWLRTDFRTESWRERALYTVHVTSRVGLWFGFAGFFLGLAVVDEPGRFTWYILLLIGLAGMQFVTAVALSQGGPRGDRPGPVR